MGDRRRRSWTLRAVHPVVRPRVVLTILVLAVGVLAVVPGLASAHEVGGTKFDAPLPLSMLYAGAGGTVALTALWLGATGRASTTTTRRRELVAIPASVARPARVAVAGLFLAVVVAALLLGFLGRQVAAENVATVFTWPVWFRGVTLLAIAMGNPWGVLSPWRAIYGGLVRLEGRPLAVLGAYPPALGAWPALLGFVLLVGIVENLTVIPRSPRLTTVVLGVYALFMVGGATLYGTAWLRHADPLGVFYRLFGRVSAVVPVPTDDGGYRVALRPPWQGCLEPVGSTPLVVFVVATVCTVSFDGFTSTRLFQTVLFHVRGALGTGPATSVLLYAVGFGGFILTFGGVSWLVERLGAGSSRDRLVAARWLAPSVLPIAAAYEVAHNYPYVIRNLVRLAGIAGGWLAPGVGVVQPLAWLSLPAFWGSQVVLIVLGHVVAVVAAHHVTVDRYDNPAAARRAHLPLVVLMVGYTVLSLWIISQPVVSG